MWVRHKKTGARFFSDNEKKRQKRLVRRLRAWWRALDGHTDNAWMVTLTYRHDVEWKANHITDFMRLLKKEGGIKAHAWVAELQPSTGKVHYHIIVIGNRPAWVMRRWGKGRTQVKQAWSVGYILKYLWKADNSGLPKSCRRFGIGVKYGYLCSQAKYIIELSKLPPYIAKICYELGGLAKKVMGGWETDEGIFIANEWERDLFQWS